MKENDEILRNERNKIILNLYNKNFSTFEISKIFKLNQNYIWEILKQNNVTIRGGTHTLGKNIGTLKPCFGYVLGTIMSDGWVSKGILGLTVKDEDFAIYFFKQLKMWSGINPNFSINNRTDGWGGKYYRICLSSIRASKFISKFLENFFEDIYTFPKETKSMLLRGLFDGDGWVCFSNEFTKKKICRVIGFQSIKNMNSRLVHNLLNEFNIKNSLSENNHSGFGSKNTNYKIQITGRNNLLNFYEKIGFTIQRKQDKLKSILKSFKINPIPLEKIK